jgi:hypothetical protein
MPATGNVACFVALNAAYSVQNSVRKALPAHIINPRCSNAPSSQLITAGKVSAALTDQAHARCVATPALSEHVLGSADQKT